LLNFSLLTSVFGLITTSSTFLVGSSFFCITLLFSFFEDGTKYFEINEKAFFNVDDWLKNHPNQSEEFQNEMNKKWGN
jgi:hypothetical protein